MAVVGFDVYGTLVDPLAMEEPLRAHVGEKAAQFASQSRQYQLDSAFRRALMRRYENFDVVTADALRFTAKLLDVIHECLDPELIASMDVVKVGLSGKGSGGSES